MKNKAAMELGKRGGLKRWGNKSKEERSREMAIVAMKGWITRRKKDTK